MRINTRPVVLLSALAAITAPVLAAVVLTGQGGAASASTAAASPLVATGSVAAEVVAAPRVVRPAAAAHPARTTPARHTVARPSARRVVTVKAPVTKPVVRTTAPKPVVHAAPAPVKTAPTVRTSDDYPWRSDSTQAADTWGFTKRQCVSFAAFRLAQHGHALNNGTQHWGSALNWDDAARANGVTVTSTPHVGAIAQWNAGEGSGIYANGSSTPNGHFTAGSYGHVGYVAAVYSDGSALIEQYNLGGTRSYSAMRMQAPRYLVF